MSELKFKLKKAGKTVGYMRVMPGQSTPWLCILYRETEEHKWFIIADGDLPLFDSIHPFVCQDRKGKDVYEGDTVHDTSVDANGTVIWREDVLEFALIMRNGLHECIIRKYIELIEATP